MQDEVHVALQACGVGHHDGHVGLAKEDKVAGDLLVLRRGGERVGTGQVDDAIRVATVAKEALGLADRLAGPVARVLLQSGQGIEDGALARVRIAGQGHDEALAVGLRTASLQAVHGCRLGTGGAG